jgi:hypothetical protein
MSEQNKEILQTLWDRCVELSDTNEEQIATLIHTKFRLFYGDHVPSSWAIGLDAPKPMTKANIINGLMKLPAECVQHFMKTFLVPCADTKCCHLMGQIPFLIDLFRSNRAFHLQGKPRRDCRVDSIK